MKTIPRFILITSHLSLITIYLLLAANAAFAQGSLTPPGAPAPTFKTLQQIEPRTPISSLPFTISTPGSYYVTGNLTGVAGSHGITITVDNVTVDLNGFVITGVAGAFHGIEMPQTVTNIVIRNGTVANWSPLSGINGINARNSHFHQLQVRSNGLGLVAGLGARVTECGAFGNTSSGISAGSGSVVSHCAASTNTGNGINAGTGSTLTDCTARDNSGTYGIFADEGSTLTNCTATSNDVEHGIHADLRSTLTNCTASSNDSAAADSWGISVGAQSTVSNCTSTANTNSNGAASDSTGGGILAGASSTVQNCTVVGNKGDGIQVANDSRVFGNNCDSNEFGGGNAAGVHATGSDNRIEGNNVTDNTRGIDVDAGGNLIVKNSASGNGTPATDNYAITGTNTIGAIVTATGTITADPWANFSY
jgi:parallel beta-helix repeat protein